MHWTPSRRQVQAKLARQPHRVIAAVVRHVYVQVLGHHLGDHSFGVDLIGQFYELDLARNSAGTQALLANPRAH